MHTVDSSTCVESVSSQELALFNTKYLHYYWLFLLSSPSLLLFVTIDLNTLSTDRMGSGCWNSWAPHFHFDTGGETENAKYDKCWHLHFLNDTQREIVCRDVSNTGKVNSLSHQDGAVSYIVTRQSAGRVSRWRENKTSHNIRKDSAYVSCCISK